MKSLFPLLIAASSLSALEPQRVEVSRDVWISAYSKEQEGNNGGSHKLKLKGIQEFFLIDFDPAPFAGKRVKKASLHLHLMSKEAPLRRTTISTITSDWVEGAGSGYEKVPGTSCFLWSKLGQTRWNSEETDITAVTCGVGGSTWGWAEASALDAAGYQTVAIAPEVVQARIDGSSFGFYVIDDVGNEYERQGDSFRYTTFVNRYVSSREDQRAYRPYFTLWLEEGAAAPAAPAPLTPQRVIATQLPPAVPVPAAGPALPFACQDELGQPLSELHFSAARGEALGFSIAVPLAGLKVVLPGVKSQLYAMPRVGSVHDPLVPAGHAAPTLEADHSFVDLYVPKDTPAGVIAGSLTAAGRSIPLRITVWNFTLPDRLSFLPQMNAYGLPNHARAYYRLAHEHRTVLNQLPYGWTGRVDEPAPKIGADGSWDWAAFDAEFGPLMDGSAFADLPRASVPVDAYYLLLNENWPMKHDELFKGGYWIDHAYQDSYWQTFRKASAEIAKHFEEKQWLEPMFEFYLNNKVYFKADNWKKCTAPWIFDEPVHTQDFWALRRFGHEFWQAVAPWQKVHMAYRGDISRPHWQRELLDHCVNTDIIAGVLRQYWQRIHARSQRLDTLYYMYGTANKPGTDNSTNAAWCIETWSLGGDGVVPWNSIGKEAAWTTPDELSLFYTTAEGPVPSLRLKTYRHGQQLVEYLTQYCAVSGQSRESVMAALRMIPGLSAKLVKKNEEDAGRSEFPAAAGKALQQLKQSLGPWLHEKAPEPKPRWYDPRPARPDERKARQVPLTE
jgi:hypothetical protein